MNLDATEWSIKEGEEVDSLLQWLDCDGNLVDTSDMAITIKLSSVGDFDQLEEHVLSSTSESVDGVTYNIAVKFLSTLTAGQYKAEFSILEDNATAPIKVASSEDLIIKPAIK